MSSTQTSLRTDIRWAVGLAFRVVLILIASALTSFAQGSETTENPVLIFNQAQAVHEKGDLAGAVVLYEKALQIMPEFPEAEYQRASALLALGKTDEAEKGYRRAVALRADWTLALSSLGSVLVQQGKYTEAEPILAKAIWRRRSSFSIRSLRCRVAAISSSSLNWARSI